MRKDMALIPWGFIEITNLVATNYEKPTAVIINKGLSKIRVTNATWRMCVSYRNLTNPSRHVSKAHGYLDKINLNQRKITKCKQK